jgi:hypothetical protein
LLSESLRLSIFLCGSLGLISDFAKKLLTLPFAVPLRRNARLTIGKPIHVKKILLVLSLVFAWSLLPAQQVDSIFFHLYTDSLKKGTHNYINVDGKLSNGTWRPMTAKELKFGSSDCEFAGNSLVIPANFTGEKIVVWAEMKNNPSQRIEKTLWIKKKPDPEFLPTKDDVIRDGNRRRRR